MGQDMKEINLETYKLCDYFNNMDMKDDTVKLKAFFKEAIIPYLSKYEEKEKNSIFDRLYYRLQRNCPGFWNLLTSLEPVKDSSQRKFEKQVSKVSKTEIEAFKNQDEFYYLT
jgi:hypothetical protein